MEEAGADILPLNEYNLELTWNDVKGAHTYVIYQNEEMAAEVAQGTESIILKDLKVSETYDIRIEVLDKTGEVIYEYLNQFEYTNIEDDTQQINLGILDNR